MSKRGRHSDHALLIFGLAFFLFNSPMNIWWSASSMPWYAMFAPWVLIIVLVCWNQMRQDHGD